MVNLNRSNVNKNIFNIYLINYERKDEDFEHFHSCSFQFHLFALNDGFEHSYS